MNHFPKRDRLMGVTTLKCASHPRTMFFYGFVKTPISWRPLLPGTWEDRHIRSFSSSRWAGVAGHESFFGA